MEVELVAAETQVVVAIGHEIQPAALGVEHRIELAGLVRRELAGLPAFEIVDPDRRIATGPGFDVGQKATVRRPGVAGQILLPTAVHLTGAAIEIDHPQPLLLVCVGQQARIRRPLRREPPDITITGDPARLAAAILCPQIQLVLARGITEVGDPTAIGRPGHAVFAGIRTAAEIARLTVLGRQGEHLATRTEYRPLTARRQVITFDEASRLDPTRPCLRKITGQAHRNFLAFATGRVEPPQPTTLLEHDPIRTRARPQDILAEIGQPARLAACRRDRIQIEVIVAIGQEIHRIAHPHRLMIGGPVIGQADRTVGREVVHPHVLRPPAAIALPGPEIPIDRRVHQLRPIRRQHATADFRNRQRRLHAAREWHPIRPAIALTGRIAVGTHQDVCAIRRPVEHPVIGATTRRHRPDIGVPGELARLTTRCRHHMHLPGAAVLGREGDPGAIRREFGVQLLPRMRGQPDRLTALSRHPIQIASVDEYHLLAVDIGKPQQLALSTDGQRKHQCRQHDSSGTEGSDHGGLAGQKTNRECSRASTTASVRMVMAAGRCRASSTHVIPHDGNISP